MSACVASASRIDENSKASDDDGCSVSFEPALSGEFDGDEVEAEVATEAAVEVAAETGDEATVSTRRSSEMRSAGDCAKAAVAPGRTRQ